MTTPLIVAIAMILDAIFGEPDWLWKRFPHPAVLLGRLVGWGDANLNNRTRLAGVVLVCGLVGIGALLGSLISMAGGLVECLAMAVLLAQKSLVQHVSNVADALRLSVQSARRSVGLIVSRDTREMSEPDIARAAIESGAENLSDGVIAPVFWALLGGLPGILIYKMINTADSMIGYRTEKHEHFGWCAAKLDDVLNWVPARLTAGLLWLAGQGAGQWSDIHADAKRHKSPNAGWPEAALSRSLGIALAGPRMYHGIREPLPWVNQTGRKSITAADIDAAVGQLWLAWTLALVVCFALTVLI